MKLKKTYQLKQIGEEFVVMNNQATSVDFTQIITLNQSAAWLWQQLEPMESFDKTTIVQLLLDEYEVDEIVAQADAETFIQNLIEHHFID